jgi:hypothetical protein
MREFRGKHRLSSDAKLPRLATWFGWRVSNRARDAHPPSSARWVTVAAIVTVGWGSLTWASVTSWEACKAACSCAARPTQNTGARAQP